MHLVPDTTRFSDLQSCEELYAYCVECGGKSRLDKYALGKQCGVDIHINTLKPMLVCQEPKCQSKAGLFATVNQDR